ncbi:alpha-L-rhamnosidase-related protein [Streptosporangium sp. NPDC002607]
MNVTEVRFEHLREPLGIGVARPRLSWIVDTTRDGWSQRAYEIEARGERVRVESADSVLVPWPFAPPASRERVAVRARVEGPDGLSPWSTHTVVEAGLLDPADWSARFVSPGTGSLLRGEFEVLPSADLRERAGRRLRELVRANGYTIATGFVGTPLICDALTEAGELDAAYRLLLERRYPSWLYPVTMGATTIWERWDSLLSDGTVNLGGMTSFNHYALGAVADWLHRTLAGLAPAEPGYRTLAIRPRPGGGLTHASARLRTLYGTAASAWRIEDGQITVEAVVPANTTAEVTLPGGERLTVGSGRHRWTVEHDRRADLAPLTLDSTLGEVSDRPGALAILTRALVRRVPELADHLKHGTGTEAQDTTVRQALALLPENEPVLAEIEEGFAALPR